MDSEKDSADTPPADNISDEKIGSSGNNNEENNISSDGSETAQKPHEYKKSDFRPKDKKADVRNPIVIAYDKNYKKLLVVPSLIVILAVAILFFNFSRTGELFQKDVSIKGGVTVTVLKSYENLDELEGFLTASLGTSVNARKLTEAGVSKGIVIDAGIETDEEVGRFLSLIQEKTGELSENQYSIQVIGSTLGASFFKAVTASIFAAFLLMAAVVLIYFRFVAGHWVIVPSLFVVWTVFVDIICTLAVISLLQIKVSTAGLAAFLLLIGYSVDTDILLTVRALKGRQGSVFERITSAAKTGIFMTLTGMAAIIAGLIFTQSETIRQIMLILAIGLAFDLLHTWLTNAGILRWYMERNVYGK